VIPVPGVNDNANGSSSANDTTATATATATVNDGKVVYCSTEQDYYHAIELAGSRLVVVDCFAEWCPPCKQIAPVFDALAKEHEEILFVKVDVDKVPSIKYILGVFAMPSFYFLKDGSKVGSFMGASEAKLRLGIANDGKIGGICASLCAIQ